MKVKTYNWTIGALSLFLAAGGVAAGADDETRSDSPNRLTLSLQFGRNIKSSFRGVGGSLNSSFNNVSGQYDNGYVLTDISGNAGNQTWNWGYASASQVNAANNTVSFDRTTASPNGAPTAGTGESGPTPGFQLDYDRELATKAEWHHLRFGLNAAVNFLPISINSSDSLSVTATRQTDVYSYTPGTTPPGAPYQGSFQGPGFVINVPPTSTTTVFANSAIASRDSFDASLWGFNVGPYVEIPFGEKQQFTLSLAGGLAVGLLSARESWNQTLSISGTPSGNFHGGGSNVDLLWGWYLRAKADYQLTKHWGVAGGAQFRDLGTYNHTFDGRQVSLDLRSSLQLFVGASYRF